MNIGKNIKEYFKLKINKTMKTMKQLNDELLEAIRIADENAKRMMKLIFG